MIKIRFYDNEETNWENDMRIFEGQMEFIHVNEYVPNVLISSINAPSIDSSSKETKLITIGERNRIYISEYINYWVEKGNTYALYLKDMMTANLVASNEILKQDAWEGVLRIGYPNNGLNIEDLLVWSSEISEKKILLTDWDRTITVVEGMYFGEKNDLLNLLNSDEIKLDDLLIYIMGGEERLEMIKYMFNKLITEYDMPIYILTHNRNASKKNYPENRLVYMKILKSVMPSSYEDNLEDMLYSSADYKENNSRSGDVNNSYRKYKSTCVVKMLKDILPKCNDLFGGYKRRNRRRRSKYTRTSKYTRRSKYTRTSKNTRTSKKTKRRKRKPK